LIESTGGIKAVKRREFITLLGGAAAAWPLAAGAQQAAKVPTIGFLGTSSASGWSPWTAAFVQRPRELGWIEGRTVAIEYRWAEGHNSRAAEIAAVFGCAAGGPILEREQDLFQVNNPCATKFRLEPAS
jgi:hypothetical protein